MERVNRRMLKAVMLPVILFFAGIMTFRVMGCKSSFLFFPSRDMPYTPEGIGLRYEEIFFDTEDRVRLHGWWVPVPDPAPAVLFCHGNAGNISYRLESIGIFHRLGLNVFIFDYRGYGKSEGRPTEEGTYRDVEAAWDYLVRVRGIPEGRVLAFGRSLGGPIAAWIAHVRKPRLLILESTFTSAAEVAGHYYSFLPTGLMLGDTYPTGNYIRDVRCPVLVIHSPDDEIIPYVLGRRLYEIAAEPKKFTTIRGPHNEGFIQSRGVYEQALKDFISAHVK